MPAPDPSSRPPPPGAAWGAGPVTRLNLPASPGGQAGQPGAGDPSGVGGPTPGTAAGDPRAHQHRMLLLYGVVAGAVLVVGLTIVLVLALTGEVGPFRTTVARPADARPPLAKLCSAPSSAPTHQPDVDPTVPAEPGPLPSGPRTVDEEAGISYTAYGAPWQPWRALWSAGTLKVPYRVGQHFITEHDYNGESDYHASILSAAVPAADNDALALDIECVGRQVAADVRAGYYPQPNRMELLRDEHTVLGGRPAWVTVFRLHFVSPGLKATDELAGVACIDVGRPTAAILYVSIPGTHRQFDWVVDDVLKSVRTT